MCKRKLFLIVALLATTFISGCLTHPDRQIPHPKPVQTPPIQKTMQHKRHKHFTQHVEKENSESGVPIANLAGASHA